MPLKPIKIRLGDLNRFLNGTTGLDVIAASTPYTFQPKQRIAPMQNQTTTDFEDHAPPPPPPKKIVKLPAIYTGTLVELIKANMKRGGEPLDGYCDYLPGFNDAAIASLAAKQIWHRITPSHVAHARGRWVGNVRRPAEPKPARSTDVQTRLDDHDGILSKARELIIELQMKVDALDGIVRTQAGMIDTLHERLTVAEDWISDFAGDDL